MKERMAYVELQVDVLGQKVLPLVIRRLYAKITRTAWSTCSCGRGFGGFESKHCHVVFNRINRSIEARGTANMQATLLCPICSYSLEKVVRTANKQA